MKKPVVSIIIPIYNVEKYLRRCLDSVLAQTFTDWEAICVNDGSPDNCDKILAEYAARDKRFKIVNKKNGGLSDARNAGMKHAHGEYVLFVDSDDFIHPQTLELTVAAARKNNADMVSFQHDDGLFRRLQRKMTYGHDIDVTRPREMSRVFNAKRVKSFTTDNILFHATERNHFSRACRPVQYHCMVWRNLCRRELIRDIDFIPGIIMEDLPWWGAVMLRHPRTVILQAGLYYYIPNPSSILNSSQSARIMNSLATGIEYLYKLYRKCAASREFDYLNREFLWPFTITAMRKLGAVTGADRDAVRRNMRRLWKLGVFDNPSGMRARKYRRRIDAFINE